MITAKLCKRCGITKSASEFYKRSNTASGLQAKCKACAADMQREWQKANPEKRAAQTAKWRNANPDKARETVNASRAKNRGHYQAMSRAWYAANRARLNEQDRAWYATNRERARLVVDAYRAANPERVKAWSRLASQRRRARLRSALVVSFTDAQLIQRMSMFGDRCWMCGAAWSHVEHVKPIVAGGAHCLANLRPACETCNKSKGSRWEGVSWIRSLSRRN